MKALRSLFVFLFISFELFSQNPKYLDSLEHVLSKTANDSVRCGIQRQLYLAYYDSIPKKAKEITRNMISTSLKNGYEKGAAGGHYLLGHLFVTTTQFDSANYHLGQSLNIGLRIKDPNISLNALEWIANVHQKRGSLDSALTNIQRAFQIAEENPGVGPQKISRIKLNEGRVYQSMGNYEAAINTYLEAEEVLPEEHIGLKGTIIARIGGIYHNLEQDQKAQEYYLRAQSIFKQTSDRNAYYSMENKLGNIAMGANNLEAAERHYLKAYVHFESVNGFYDMATIGSNLGYIYLQQEKYDLAKTYFEGAIALSEQYGQLSLLPYSYNGLGELYGKTGNLDSAIATYKKAIDLADNAAAHEYLMDTYTFLVGAYAQKNDFKSAFDQQSQLIQLKDSIDQKSSLAQISDIEAKYQNEKKQREIESLTSQSQLAAQRSQNQRNVLVAGLLVLGLAFGTLFFLFRNKQKTNKRLLELEAAKSKFFANISHEFRTPLTLISGPVAHQLSKEGLSADDKTDLGLIQRNANRLLTYVNQILDLSKIEAGSRKLRVTQGNLPLFLHHLIEPFQYQANQKGILLETTIQIDNEVWFDRDVVEKIVSNLLSNALKYNQNKGVIGFKAMQAKQQLIITTTNENRNLTAKELPQLFDRFYQNSNLHQGFGIGLSLVKELAFLAHGKVRAYKPNPTIIAFEVALPLLKSAFSKSDFIHESEVPEIRAPESDALLQDLNPMEEGPEENALPVLLVVDDNAEIRLFIRSLFKKEYHILEAENGEEGSQIALRTIPDLIVSDVMMPVKDGIFMSNVLKNDQRTSHIPIILLTAKSGEENELTGLKTGADAYMVKPFKEEKLRVIIETLIATRTAIQQKFSKQFLVDSKGIELTTVDTRLMERIQHLLDTELVNPEFNATAFSDQIGLSRMHLHRKLKALTGLSTSEFIRVQRLNLAAKLLKEGHTAIAEVGYATGFNQPAYFSTAFKQHFGCSPTEYAIA